MLGNNRIVTRILADELFKLSSMQRYKLQRILTHSFSRVVLRALIDAKGSGVDVHIFVTESHPDVSGRRPSSLCLFIFRLVYYFFSHYKG